MDSPHQPGRPKTARPPAELKRIAAALGRSWVAGVGLTTTKAGEWALLVQVPAGRPTPVPEIEAKAGGYPVIYEQRVQLPLARPAFPDRDE